jgi:hypothetical protein
VRLDADGARGPEAAVAPDGRVLLPRPVRGRAFRLHVMAAAFPPGTPPRAMRRRAVGIGELRAAGIGRLRVPRTGTVRLPCGAIAADVRRPGAAVPAAALRMELRTELARLDAGRELRATACGGPVALPAGPLDVTAAGTVLRADHLNLRTRRSGVFVTEGQGGAVRPGRLEPGARRDASVRVDGPAWLVHGESYSRGWRASCDGRDLGEPVPLQGYATAWLLDAPGCADLDLEFAPDAAVRAAGAVSLAAALVLLAVVVWPRRRGGTEPAPPAELPEPDAGLRPRPLVLALAAGALAGGVSGFVFALRAGVLIGPGVALILWRAIPSRQLVLAAGALLGVVVPLLYLALPARDRGGYSTTYPEEHLEAHWAAVAAVALLATALVRGLAVSTARARRDVPAAAPPGADGPGEAP